MTGLIVGLVQGASGDYILGAADHLRRAAFEGPAL